MANPFENESTRTVDRTPPAKEKQGELLIKVRVPAAGGGYTNIEIPKWLYDLLYQTGRMNIFPLTGFSTSYSPEAVEIAKQLHPEAYVEPTENVFNDLMFGGAGIYRAAANGALRGLSGTIREWAPKMTFRSAYGNTPLATAGDAAVVAVPTGYEVNDLIQNGPTVENVTGSILGLGGLAFEAVPTVIEGLLSSRAYNTYQLGRSLNKAINNYQDSTIPLNIGWGPKQTLIVTRAQNSTKLPLGFFLKRWDVVSEGANPNGAWFLGLLGIPRTIPSKAIKSARARNTFAVRPVLLRGELTMEKPIVTIGDVPSRNALSYQAELLGSDGIIYNNVYDNGYDANLVILAFNPESFNNTSRRFGQGTLTTAERLGIPKGERNLPANLEPIQFSKLFPKRTSYILDEISQDYIKGLDPDNGAIYVDFNSNFPLIFNTSKFYLESMLPRAKSFGIEFPTITPEENMITFVDPGTNPVLLKFLFSKKGAYSPNQNLAAIKLEVTPLRKVLTPRGSTLNDLESTTVHEGFSHVTDKYIPSDIVKEYERVLLKLGITPKKIEEIGKSAPVVWQELRSTLKEVEYAANKKGINLASVTDELLESLLKEVGSSYAGTYNRHAKYNKAYDALRYGLTLPALVGIGLSNTNNENN